MTFRAVSKEPLEHSLLFFLHNLHRLACAFEVKRNNTHEETQHEGESLGQKESTHTHTPSNNDSVEFVLGVKPPGIKLSVRCVVPAPLDSN